MSDKCEIIFEDNNIITCVKPQGVPSQADKSGDDDMLTMLSEYRKSRKSSGYVGLLHRLDRATGGVMLFSVNEKITNKLSEKISAGELEKTYYAIVYGIPKESRALLEDYMCRDSITNMSRTCSPSQKGAKRARLSYTVCGSAEFEGKDVSLLKINLMTGRTHQIRVQFSSRGLPLLGDGKYGIRDNLKNIALWSYKIKISHPVTNKEMEFKKMPPNSEPWKLFEMPND